MAKVKKTIEVSKKDLDEIIIAFGLLKDCLREDCKEFNNPILKKHYRNVINKYNRRMIKWAKKRNELFTPERTHFSGEIVKI